MADKDLSALLAELGGNNPQNRAIAEGLQKQGIGSTKDIGVQRVLIPRHMEGTDEGAYMVDDSYENKYFNKKDNSEINPTRLGVYQVDKNGKAQGDIFFHLNADDKGNVSFAPQWSPRAHGFLRDNAVGQAIMAIGKIIPATSPFFLAASAADAAAHGNYGAAIANLVPMGIQQLVAGTDVLSQLGGENFTPTAATPGGQIAEALGVPSQVADQVGKAATQAVKAGLTGKDAGEALLKSGIGSLVGTGADYLKGVGGELLNDVKGGITTLFGDSVADASGFSKDELDKLGVESESNLSLSSSPSSQLTKEDIERNTNIVPKGGFQGNGFGNIGEGEFDDEIKAPVDLNARDNIEPDQDNIDEFVNNPFQAVDDSGIGSPDTTVSSTGTDTIAGAAGNDGLTGKGGITDLKPVAYDDEGNLMPGYELDSEGNAVWMGGSSDYVSPEGGGMVDDSGFIETVDGGDGNDTLTSGTGNDTLTAGGGNDTLTGGSRNDTIVSGGGNDTLTGGGINDLIKVVGKVLPVVPAIFPPRRNVDPRVRTVTPTVTGGTVVDTIKGGGGNDTLTGGTGNDTLKGGGGNDGLTGIVDKLLGGTDALKGKYNFSWNQQEAKAPEKGIAYGQRYYGPHWSQQAAAQSAAKDAVLSKDEPMTNQTVEQHADGGLMALDKTMLNTTFKPTMTDSGIQASDITKHDVTNQVIQHMRRGGHLIDHKTHKDVHYLASKGEPVHHIVGFMNHRKRMAEGGITSHSLGSYSDGGHLLKGPGDGMSDDIPATIADKQPARLANEEFVIPADVVSHLGNGSSESGAKVLYEMMARIRKARTGNPKQGKQIDPHKLMPKV